MSRPMDELQQLIKKLHLGRMAESLPEELPRAEKEGLPYTELLLVPLLCIDEMGYLTLRPEQSNIFFKLMEERYRRRASRITTNLDYDDWFNFLGNKPMVTALLSRLRHQCTTIRIDGPSLREPQG
jgi:DNA replication protein DnaC